MKPLISLLPANSLYIIVELEKSKILNNTYL